MTETLVLLAFDSILNLMYQGIFITHLLHAMEIDNQFLFIFTGLEFIKGLDLRIFIYKPNL